MGCGLNPESSKETIHNIREDTASLPTSTTNCSSVLELLGARTLQFLAAP